MPAESKKQQRSVQTGEVSPMKKAEFVFNKLSSINAAQAEQALSQHNTKMYRASKEYIRKRLADEVKYTPTEYISPASHLEKNSNVAKYFKSGIGRAKRVLTGQTAKNIGIGFVAGTAASNIASAITYPVDTKNVRAQTGQPAPKGIKEHYSGFGTKMLKNTLTLGTAFALQDPIKQLIIKGFTKKAERRNLPSIAKSKESSLIKDFAAGLEPTGVITFQNAMKNRRRHSLHRHVGNVGGFIGGAAISPAATAIPTIGLGKILKRKNPALGRMLEESGKHMMSIYNPRSVKKMVRHGGKALRSSLAKREHVEAIEKNINKVRVTGRFTSSVRKNIAGAAKGLKKSYKEGVDLEKATGIDTSELTQKTFAGIGGAATAALGGGINAMSANLQYRSGKSVGENLRKNPKK